MTLRLVVATRSADKLREIREVLAAWPSLHVVGLDEAGVAETAEEEGIEAFDTFEENALAKARWFAARVGGLVLADDSGLAVDAIDGAPGVRSRRFAPGPPLRGRDQDDANNRHLLDRLSGIPAEERTARYVCVAALVGPDGEERTFRGECEGVILDGPRGDGGFGYDPLFFLPAEGRTFGELERGRKNGLSHRGRAMRAAGAHLGARVDGT